jgi:hypothetical protein
MLLAPNSNTIFFFYISRVDLDFYLSLVKRELGGDARALRVGSLGGGGGQESGEDKDVATHGTCKPVVG